YLNGSLISKYNDIHKIYDEYDDLDELLVNIIIQYYSNNLLPEKVIVMLNNEKIKELVDYFKIKFEVPNSKEKEIMQMGITNAKSYLLNNRLSEQRNYDSTIGACNELAKILNIPNIEFIEAFDNSNINLKHSISAMVSFKNGLPQKNEYRKYNLQTTENKSDFQYMQEVIYRRYKYLLDSNLRLPDLIIVDGGKLQIHAALNSLKELNIENNITIIGLKKNNKHQTHSIVFSNDKEMELDRKSGLFNLLCNIQNEVHNYAISFYRSKHIKSMITSFLDDIKGLGEKSKNKILQNYPNMSLLNRLTENELLQILPSKKAKLVIDAINKEKNN
nr:excinuclease ABC subunit UvrC [Ureaplasma sp.]